MASDTRLLENEKSMKLRFWHLVRFFPSPFYFASWIISIYYYYLHYKKVPYLVNFTSHLVSSLFVNKLLKVFAHRLFVTFVLKVYDFLKHWISSLPICLMFIQGLGFVGTTRFFSFNFLLIFLRFRVCNFAGMSNFFSSYMFVVCSRFKVCWNNEVLLFLFVHHLFNVKGSQFCWNIKLFLFLLVHCHQHICLMFKVWCSVRLFLLMFAHHLFIKLFKI
jgi:hypothetical protein